MVVLVQREVAGRFTAKPGTDDRGTAAVWLQSGYDIDIVRIVKPTCFWPKPDVTSAVVRFRRSNRYGLSPEAAAKLMSVSKVAFQHRRKQMASLYKSAGEISADPDEIRARLEACGASQTARAEELSVEQWIRFSTRFI